MFSAISRRTFLEAGVSMVGFYERGRSSSQRSGGDLNENYKDFESGDLPDLRQLGTSPPLRAEIELADRLLSKAPVKKNPFEVFKYLEALQQTNKDKERYNGGWRTRWNPVIVRFFEQTKTKPSGDTTPWCAAALNWCLAISDFNTTSSASSGSFRAVAGITTTPQVGDIVVFQSADREEANAGRGHVGLFLSETDTEIHVLGGNQKTDAGHHAVCRKPFKKVGSKLIFHSYHSVEALRRA
jgi:uncharacterized protein (TIGR02594 family)